MKLPCFSEAGLKIFSTTAAQRYKLGKDIFLDTHYPIKLRSFNINGAVDVYKEGDLLESLLDTQGIQRGNRLTLLYGAAGSGKSELMAWLDIKLQNLTDRPLLRVARTELNILSIIEQLQHWLTGDFFDETTHSRWQAMRQKPRTFSKLLVLKALEQMIDSDSMINALYYRLLDVVEPHITRVLELNERDYLELIPRETFEELREETALPVDINFEQFRKRLLDEFRKQLLENTDIPTTLQKISENLSSKGKRPILLIDDLVQSINIFATDFLDYFITLDRGEWDVVIGLTPASFETDKRHRELLQRITHLDTIDDRVSKLWLSDQLGEVSYFLSEDNCNEFAYGYLQAFRKMNNLNCENCSALKKCRFLSSENKIILAPFNEATLKRIFRNLPNYKGKVRYFLKYLHDILRDLIRGESIATAFSRYLSPTIAVEADNSALQDVATWYAPIMDNSGEINLDSRLLSFFDLPSDKSTVHIQPLTRNISLSSQYENSDPVLHPSREAISKWLEKEEINRQLLNDLRQGVSGWLRGVYPVEYFHRAGTSKPKSVIRYKRMEMNSSPPIKIQDIDSFDGIKLHRKIGHMAFSFDDLARASRDDARELCYLLSQQAENATLILEGYQYRNAYWKQLEHLISTNLDDFALGVFIITCIANGKPNRLPPGISSEIWMQVDYLYQQILIRTQRRQLFDKRTAKVGFDLFDDFYRLRKNLYDGPKIKEKCEIYDVDYIFELINQIDIEIVDESYKASNLSLSAYILKLKTVISLCEEIKIQSEWKISDDTSQETETILHQLKLGNSVTISEINPAVLEEIRELTPDLHKQIIVRLQLQSLSLNVKGDIETQE